MQPIKPTNKYAHTDELEAINLRSRELGLEHTLSPELFDLEVIDPWGQHYCAGLLKDEYAAGLDVQIQVRTGWWIDVNEEEPELHLLDMERGAYEALPELDEETRQRALDLGAGMEEWREEDGSIDRERLKQLIEDAKRR